MISIVSYAQNHPLLDVFEKNIGHLPFETQIDTLIKVYEEIVPHDQNKSLKYLDRAIEISEANSYDKGLAHGLAKKGNHFLTIDQDLKVAEKYLLEGIKVAQRMENKELLPGLYNRLGGVYFGYGKLDEALIYMRKGEKVAIAIQSKKEILDFAINIAAIHAQMKHFELAKERFVKCLALEPNERQTSMIQNNLGATYSKLENYDSAVYYYRQSMNYCKQQVNPERCKSSALHNIATAQLKMGRYKESLESYTSLEKILRNSGEEQLFTRLIINKGISYKRLEMYDSAVITFKQALILTKKNLMNPELRQAYHQLFTVYKCLGQYDTALQYHEKYVTIKDSLFNADNSRNIEELLAKYESEKKEKEIALLKRERLQQEVLMKERQTHFDQKRLTDSLLSQHKENEILQLKGKNEVQQVLIEKNQIEKLRKDGEILLLQKQKELKTIEAKRQSQLRNGVVIGAVLLLIPALILIFFYQQKIKDKELLYAKTEEINKQKTLKIIRDHELEAIKAHIEGQEKEKARISSDLHDGIAGSLAGIKLMLSKIADDIPQDKRLTTVVRKMDETYEEVRAITHQLNPPGIRDGSFSQLINNMLQDISSGSSFDVSFTCHPPKNLDRLNDDIKIEVYRITQELMSNIIKHAQPGQVEVQLVMNDSDVNLLIEDDGVGFDTNRQVQGIGLSSIRSRVIKLQGAIDIDSRIGRGTIASINIPVV